jgi:hypothetical protein
MGGGGGERGQICYFVIAVGLGEDAVGKTEQEADPASLQRVE